MVNYNQAYLESLVKPGSTRLSILVDNCQKPDKSGSTRVSQTHQAFNQTSGARVELKNIKYKRKNIKDSGRSSKMTPCANGLFRVQNGFQNRG